MLTEIYVARWRHWFDNELRTSAKNDATEATQLKYINTTVACLLRPLIHFYHNLLTSALARHVFYNKEKTVHSTALVLVTLADNPKAAR